MNNKVDVLAVVDELIDFEERHAECEPRQNHEAREARAAFAELIEVTDLALGWVNGPTKAEKAMRDRIRAALSRVKGE